MIILVSLLDCLFRRGSNRSAVIIDDDFLANFIALQPYPFNSPFYNNHGKLSIPVRMPISKYIAEETRPGNPLYQVSINRKLMETMIHFSSIFFHLSPVSAVLIKNNALILEKADILPVFYCLVYRPFALKGRTYSADNYSAPIPEVCYGAFELHNRPSGYLIRLFFDLPMVSKMTHWQTVKSRCLAVVQLHSAIELRRHRFLSLAAKAFTMRLYSEGTPGGEKKKSEDKKVSIIVPVLSIYLPIKTRNHYPHCAVPRSREQMISGICQHPIELSTLVKGELLLLFPALRLHLFLFLAAKTREETRSKEENSKFQTSALMSIITVPLSQPCLLLLLIEESFFNQLKNIVITSEFRGGCGPGKISLKKYPGLLQRGFLSFFLRVPSRALAAK